MKIHAPAKPNKACKSSEKESQSQVASTSVLMNSEFLLSAIPAAVLYDDRKILFHRVVSLKFSDLLYTTTVKSLVLIRCVICRTYCFTKSNHLNEAVSPQFYCSHCLHAVFTPKRIKVLYTALRLK